MINAFVHSFCAWRIVLIFSDSERRTRQRFSHPWTSPPDLSNAPQSTAIRPSHPPSTLKGWLGLWARDAAFSPISAVLAHSANSRVSATRQPPSSSLHFPASPSRSIHHSLTLVFLFLASVLAKQQLEDLARPNRPFIASPRLAVITSLPFTLSNLFSSFHLSPSPPPHPPKTNQSGSMPLTRRRRCLPKCPRPSSDLERVGLCCAPYCLDPFLFSILAYFDISRFLSLDLDSCSRSSLPLFVPLELVHRLSPTTFFPRSVCSPPIHYLLTDRVVCGSHVI